MFKDVLCFNRGSRLLIVHCVGIYKVQAAESEVTNGPGGSADIQRIACGYQHDPERIAEHLLLQIRVAVQTFFVKFKEPASLLVPHSLLPNSYLHVFSKLIKKR